MLLSSIVVGFNSGARNFGCKQENQKILNSGFEVNITTMEMMEDSESMVAETKSLAYRTKPALSPMRKEVMYTPQKDESDPDRLPSVVPPKELHFDENNTPQPMPYQSLGEAEVRQHDPFSILESHDEAIKAFGLVIEQVVGFTTSLAKRNHGEVSQAFEHLSHHRQCVEKLRHRVRRLMENEENSQEFMGGLDNLLQNSILPSLKKHSTGLKEMFLFRKLTECNLGALEGRVQSLIGMEHHHESLRQQVDQVQQGNDQNSALAQQRSCASQRGAPPSHPAGHLATHPARHHCFVHACLPGRPCSQDLLSPIDGMCGKISFPLNKAHHALGWGFGFFACVGIQT